jgi:hypothetical protein
MQAPASTVLFTSTVVTFFCAESHTVEHPLKSLVFCIMNDVDESTALLPKKPIIKAVPERSSDNPLLQKKKKLFSDKMREFCTWMSAFSRYGLLVDPDCAGNKNELESAPEAMEGQAPASQQDKTPPHKVLDSPLLRQDRCKERATMDEGARVVAVLGSGGRGKTSLIREALHHSGRSGGQSLGLIERTVCAVLLFAFQWLACSSNNNLPSFCCSYMQLMTRTRLTVSLNKGLLR